MAAPPHERVHIDAAGLVPLMPCRQRIERAEGPGPFVDRQLVGMLGRRLMSMRGAFVCDERDSHGPPSPMSTERPRRVSSISRHPSRGAVMTYVGPPDEGASYVAVAITEPVALAGDGLDVARCAPVVAELHAQLAHVSVDDVAFDLEGVAPDVGEKGFAREYLPRVRREDIQERWWDGRELEPAPAVQRHGLRDEVELELAAERDRGNKGHRKPARPTQQCVGPRDDLVERERHLDDVVRALLIRVQLHRRVAPAREREDRYPALRQAAADQIDHANVVVDIDDREMRPPVTKERSDRGLVHRVARLVMAVTERHRDKVRQRVRDDEQDTRRSAVVLGHRGLGIACGHMTLCNGIDGLRHEWGSRARRTRVGIRKRTMARLRGGTATPVPSQRTPHASAVLSSKNANESPAERTDRVLGGRSFSAGLSRAISPAN